MKRHFVCVCVCVCVYSFQKSANTYACQHGARDNTYTYDEISYTIVFAL